MFPDDGNLSAFTDSELAELETQLVGSFNEASESDLTDDSIAELGKFADNIDIVRAEKAAREELAATRAAAVSELANRVNASTTEPEAPAEAEPTEGEPAEAPAEPAEEPEAPAEAPASAPAAAPSNVTAGATLAQAQRRQPAATRPRVTNESARAGSVSITAAADIPGVSAGSKITSIKQVGQMMHDRAQKFGKGSGGGSEDVTVAQFKIDFPSERVIRDGDDIMEKIAQFDTSPQGITAAGGLCAPTTGYYDQMILSDSDRPVRDGLPTFNATRGGIRYNLPPTLADIVAGSPANVGVITAAQDASNVQKTCFTITCNGITEVLVSAIYNCLTFGNFGARAFPEQVEAWTKLSLANQARVSETLLLDAMAALSTTVTAAGYVGAGREFLNILGRAAAGYRSRHRMSPDAPFHVFLPAWLVDLAAADLVRTLSDVDEGFAIVRADLERWLNARHINVTWYIDSKTGGGQVFGAAVGGQTYTDFATTSASPTVTSSTAGFTTADIGRTITATGIPAGATITAVGSGTSVTMSANSTATGTNVTGTINRPVLQQWPNKIFSYLFPEGTFIHLDSGTLDLGLVRDSTLNLKNQFQTFTENFENLARVGPESLEIVMTLYPDGSYGAAKTITVPFNS